MVWFLYDRDLRHERVNNERNFEVIPNQELILVENFAQRMNMQKQSPEVFC